MKTPLAVFLMVAVLSSCTLEDQQKEVFEEEANKQISVCINQDEMALYELINEYRVDNGLEEIELSASLTYVAQEHSRDLSVNQPATDGCNLHSWSGNGDWTECCYNGSGKADCMWGKPRELTNYTGNGYEISYYTSGGFDVKEALKRWKESTGHNALLINDGSWEHVEWNAVGIGIYDGYANVWFGEVHDKAAALGDCLTSK